MDKKKNVMVTKCHLLISLIVVVLLVMSTDCRVSRRGGSHRSSGRRGSSFSFGKNHATHESASHSASRSSHSNTAGVHSHSSSPLSLGNGASDQQAVPPLTGQLSSSSVPSSSLMAAAAPAPLIPMVQHQMFHYPHDDPVKRQGTTGDLNQQKTDSAKRMEASKATLTTTTSASRSAGEPARDGDSQSSWFWSAAVPSPMLGGSHYQNGRYHLRGRNNTTTDLNKQKVDDVKRNETTVASAMEGASKSSWWVW